jgi:putative MATE family efflux protein
MKHPPTDSPSTDADGDMPCEIPAPVALASSPSGSAHVDYEPKAEALLGMPSATSHGQILRQLVWLAGPVLAETLLHTVVGLNDTYLANHLPPNPAASTAAVGTVMYFFWFIGLFSGAIGTGATALIARATGAREPERANILCGQAMLLAGVLGLLLGGAFYFAADFLVYATGLPGAGAMGGLPTPGTPAALAADYFRYLSPGVPAVVVLAVANASLRGVGDTLRPAIAMIVVGLLTILLTNTFTHGWFGVPKLGFVGLAVGTAIPYATGAVLQVGLLLSHRLRLRLSVAGLRPHGVEMTRLLRIGLPAGAENLMMWSANFVLLRIINQLDVTAASAAAHANAIRLEALSFMSGFAVSVAAASLVGQKLGANDPAGAKRVAHMAWLLGGGIMCVMGLSFLILPGTYANFLSEDPRVVELTTMCLFIAAFCQPGFSAAIIFGGALRGAGDTLVVMLMTLGSILVLRVCGVLIVTQYFGLGLTAVWWVLAADLTVRGVLAYWRFSTGRWAKLKI